MSASRLRVAVVIPTLDEETAIVRGGQGEGRRIPL